MRRSSYCEDFVPTSRDSSYLSTQDPYGYPSTTTTTRRDSKWDVSEYSLRDYESPRSSSSRPRSRSRSARPPTSPRDKPRRRKVSGAKASHGNSDNDISERSSNAVVSFSPTALFGNLQSAFNAFQSVSSFTSAAGNSASDSTGFSSFEWAPLPETPVANLLNPKNLTPPSSQAILHDRLAANLPRHGNAYIILLVGTLLATHWLVLAALFAVVKFGFFLQAYNGRDLASELGVRQYASSQGVMSGFAAATALVALWAFSSVFSVVVTLVKVACLILLHAAFFEVGEEEKSKPTLVGQASSTSLGSPNSGAAVPGVLRPAGTQLSPHEAAAFAGQQLRSASDSHLSAAYANGWYAGEGYAGGGERDVYASMPRTPRSYEHGVSDVASSWGYPEPGSRPQSYASGRPY